MSEKKPDLEPETAAAEPKPDPAEASKAYTRAAPANEAGAEPVDLEETVLADEGEAGVTGIDSIEEISALNAQVDDLRDRLLRAAAETENVRRRAERDKLDAAKFAVSKFAGDMLSVADNFSRAMEAVPPEALEGADDRLKNLFSGIQAVDRELQNALTRHGVTRIEIGEKEIFDPNRHEVMFEIEDPSKPRGTILQVLQDGYMLHERLLRPARVGVAKGGQDGPVNQTA
jgi:molecular chaperone GrpE